MQGSSRWAWLGLLLVAFVVPGPALAQPAPPAGTPAEITVQNETDLTLTYLYIDPAGARRGEDRLGQDTVAPATTYRARLGRQAGCSFDVTAIWQDRTEEVRRAVDLCATPRLVFGDPAMPTLDVAVGNNSDTVLRELYASTSGTSGAWGPDRLGSEVIPANGAFRMRIRTRDCTFDIRAVFADDREEVKARVDLCAERGVVFDRSGIPRPESRSLVLANRHLATVAQVYVSSSSDADWGPDRLGAELLPTGEETTLALEVECRVDIRILFPGGGIEERRAVDICAAPRLVLTPGWVAASAPDAAGPSAGTPEPGETAGVLSLRNAGPLPIVEIYAFPPGEPRGTDRLGADILPVGEVLDLEAPDGDACLADVVAVFRDGREVTHSGLDLCKAGEIEIR
ncbi:hypothetical protein ACLF3G_16970 [Falsiroseomonas sp. HC035]|uniref:hypothetical protein n=1 Tax=Falsiroseomonas sp. HC035 TaxID=3390999 RepID=UPI003D319FAC